MQSEFLLRPYGALGFHGPLRCYQYAVPLGQGGAFISKICGEYYLFFMGPIIPSLTASGSALTDFHRQQRSPSPERASSISQGHRPWNQSVANAGSQALQGRNMSPDARIFIFHFNYTCMTTKLTLTVDEEVIRAAKEYAAGKGTSLSALVENYLRSLPGGKGDKGKSRLSPRVARLKGCIQLPEDFDYKKALAEAVSKRHA